MKRVIFLFALLLSTGLAIGTSYEPGDSYCVIFPQFGRDMFGVAQRNILIIEDQRVSLIPQVHFEGDAEDFGIMVPVPARPQLATASANIFSEASFMTQPLVRDANQGCGCDSETGIVAAGFENRPDKDGRTLVEEDANAGVTVIYEDIVGTFQAAVLQAADAGDLVRWLNENQYHFNPADSTVLAEYVQKNWFFVAMKLDTAQVPPRIDPWWSATTAPAKISFPYTAETLTYPLKVSAISTKEKVEVLVYTISKDPMRFDGADVEYANEIEKSELPAIAERYPALYDYLFEGSFVTKLRRSFRKSEMTSDIEIHPVDDRTEFRQIVYRDGGGGFFRVAGMLSLVLLLKGRRRFWG